MAAVHWDVDHHVRIINTNTASLSTTLLICTLLITIQTLRTWGFTELLHNDGQSILFAWHVKVCSCTSNSAAKTQKAAKRSSWLTYEESVRVTAVMQCRADHPILSRGTFAALKIKCHSCYRNATHRFITSLSFSSSPPRGYGSLLEDLTLILKKLRFNNWWLNRYNIAGSCPWTAPVQPVTLFLIQHRIYLADLSGEKKKRKKKAVSSATSVCEASPCPSYQ